MIIVLQKKVPNTKITELIEFLNINNIENNLLHGDNRDIIEIKSNPKAVTKKQLLMWDIIDDVYEMNQAEVSFVEKPLNNIINVNGVHFGEGYFTIIAGPCAVESKQQIEEIAEEIKKQGANILRGGAYKPRTSPHSFQGLKEKGIEYLLHAKKNTGLPIITEIMSTEHLEFFHEVDIIQVGARNMQNFELLKMLGKMDKPILLKRGAGNTIEELLMSAEYISSGGNNKIILCERGIRTFEGYTRNTLDISAIPILKKLSPYPVIVDPSHSSGIPWLIEPLTKASIAAGADGVMVETHNNPCKALSDAAQALTLDQFSNLTKTIKKYANFEGKKIDQI